MSAGAVATIVLGAWVVLALAYFAKREGWRTTLQVLGLLVVVSVAIALLVCLLGMMETNMWPWEPGFWEMAQ